MREYQLEKDLIAILCEEENQWSYRADIKTEAQLWENLRKHINRINKHVLNDVLLTNKEFEELKIQFKILTQTPFQASQWLRGENGLASIMIEREDVSQGRITLLIFSNKDIAGGISSYEVVNQITPETGDGKRGDVTLLINGLPIIHIELKTEFAKDGYTQAFDQIKRYAQNGFFDEIYGAVQIFIVSNKVATKYFARPSSNNDADFERARKFLFNWRTPNNEPVENLYDFTRQVLKIPTSHELVSRFSVLVDDKKNQKFLMVLRPYQIHAIKKIKSQASKREGGFIWHATGSGKTITSFVATKLLAQTAIGVDRTVMVVDRTDLDNQTKNEFSKFASEYHTGLSTGEATDNSLIVGIKNHHDLMRNLISNKNNNTIMITTIQKISAAVRDAKEKDQHKFEKLRGEHIVFIVDEAHRAVSDEQMREITDLLPTSTWFGLTGTPIFEENKKQENGTFARTTYQQYGDLLHAYTTKNAMDDRSVLDFQIEYYSLLDEENETELYYNKILEEKPKADPAIIFNKLTPIEKEKLLQNKDFENDDYIKAMLQKIFKHHSIMEKFKILNGFPTMSAILTTHSIAQAKRIYHTLQKMKQEGCLISDKKQQLRDGDFPRVAITYSVNENNQNEIEAQREELENIMQDYNAQFNTNFSLGEIENYNRNINNRLARKDLQYQLDGQWLDFVIVVDRLLTGFDAPTIQTLYVDREFKYQKMLQAFSRTNRTLAGKGIGMIVTFRKPHTMRQNVADTMRLFSNEKQGWELLKPKEYTDVRKEFQDVYYSFQLAKENLQNDPNDLKKKLDSVKAYQQLEKTYKAIRSYDDFSEELEQFDHIVESLPAEKGQCENLKAEITLELVEEEDADLESLLKDIEFSSSTNKTAEDKVDSFYINQILRDVQDDKEGSREKLEQQIGSKPEVVKTVYYDILDQIDNGETFTNETSTTYFTENMDRIIEETAQKLKVPIESLEASFNQYQAGKEDVPYINQIIKTSQLDEETFENLFNEKSRKRTIVMKQYWKDIMEEKLVPLKEELK